MSTISETSPTEAIPTILSDWKKAVQSGDVNSIVKLYNGNATLKGTFRDEPVTGHEEIAQYFQELLARAKEGTSITVEFKETSQINDTDFKGGYSFSYTDAEGQKVEQAATFEFKIHNNKIQLHHSYKPEDTPQALQKYLPSPPQ